MSRIPLLALALLCALPRAPLAQGDSRAALERPRENRRGFFVGFDPAVYAVLSSSRVTQGRSPGGLGVALRFGWSFNERLALVMDVPVTDLPVADSADYLLAHGDIALVYSPADLQLGRRLLVPFVQVGGGIRSLDATFYNGGSPQLYTLEGEVLSLGAGARLYVNRRWAISLQCWWSSSEFNDERLGNTTTHNRGIAATSWRVQTGLELHIGRKPRCNC